MAFEPEHVARSGRVGIDRRHIPGAPGTDAMRKWRTAHLLERPDHLQHAVARSGAQVEDLAAGHVLPVEPAKRQHMGPRKVHHVDVIADTASIRGIVSPNTVRPFRSPPRSA